MPSLTELSKIIESIQSEKQSGVVMCSGTSDSSPAPMTFSLRFESGELSRASAGGKPGGVNAVMGLYSLKELKQLQWMPLNPTANWAGPPEMPAQELAALFGVGPSDAAAVGGFGVADDTAALLAHVEDVFLHFYVGDAKADLAALQEKFPPQTQRDAFLNACVQQLSTWVGRPEAKRLLVKKTGD